MLKKIFGLCLAFSLLGVTACTRASKLAQPIIAEEVAGLIEPYRQALPQRMQAEKIPGLAIAVVDDQRILWAEGFGYTDWNHQTPVTADTLFSIQSMSKSFTATAVMFAAQDGLVNLDEPITTYLPDFHVNSLFEEHPEQKMTLRMLLSHTAGLVHEAPIGGNSDLPNHTFEEHIASISDTWLKFPVGTRWAYSNLGIDLAGYIVQVRSGLPFTQYVQEKVLKPLGMTSSTLDIKAVRATSDRAIGHSLMPFRPPAEFLLIPSGGVWTTANDMVRYLQFHINEGAMDGERLLDQALAETMYEPPNPAALHAEYALGIGTAPWQGTRRFEHGGGGFGFNSNMIWYPELKLGAVVLTNAEHENLRTQILDEVLGSIISADIPLYHSRASTLPSVPPTYGYMKDSPPLLTDSALQSLIVSKSLLGDAADPQRSQLYTGTYIQTRWGFPLTVAQVKENNELLTVTTHDQPVTLTLTEIQPGLLFDSQGDFYNLSQTVAATPNYPLFKVNPQVLPFQLAFYVLCGLVFLSTLFLWPIRAVVRRVRQKDSLQINSIVGNTQNHVPVRMGILSGLASLFSLLCIGFLARLPNLIYVPWPRPYIDLAWWQFALLSLPFVNLFLAGALVLLSLIKRNSAERRITRFYFLTIALTVLGFNALLIY